MSKLIRKWKPTGLLEGIEDDFRKQFVAETLNATGDWMVANLNTYPEEFNDILLSIMCRVARETQYFFDAKETLSRFTKEQNTLDILEGFKKIPSIRNDVESILCEIYSKIIINEINIENDDKV